MEKPKISGLKEFVSSSKGDKNKYAELIGDMFHCRDFVHLAHLKSQSYAQHVALGDLYDALESSADEICELLQGYMGLLDIKIPEVTLTEPLSYIKMEQKEYINKIKEFNNMPDVQNKLQDLLAVFSRTIYKLENLK